MENDSYVLPQNCFVFDTYMIFPKLRSPKEELTFDIKLKFSRGGGLIFL